MSFSLDYRTAQKISGVALVLSLFVFFFSIPIIKWLRPNIIEPQATPTPYSSPTPVPSPSPLPSVTPLPFPSPTSPPLSESSGSNNNAMFLVGIISFLTSVTSLLGFISTTVLAWRKEQREAESVRIDNERKRLENEKLERELVELRKLGKPKGRIRKPKNKSQ